MPSTVWSPGSAQVPVYPQLAGLTGSAFIGFSQSGANAALLSVQDNLRESINVLQFGAKANAIFDDGPAYNAAILEMSKRGGGVVRGKVGISKIITPIICCTDVSLDLRGVKLVGTGANVGVTAGAVLAGILTDIAPEFGTGTTGSGQHFVGNCQIYGGRFANFAVGIRAQRFNYGSTIEHNIFEASCAQSYYSTQSWGLRVHQNTIYAPSVMSDFVDWTEVTGNNWEGSNSAAGTTALTLQGNFGGSYSARILSNGFHHWTTGIAANTENRNLTIQGNHFEDVKYGVIGNNLSSAFANITHNWFKANLSEAGTCIAIKFPNSVQCTYEPNTYATDGVSTHDAQLLLNSQNNIGNAITLPYSPSSTMDLTKYQISDPNPITQYGGSNNSFLFQPTVETRSGTGAYTFEKYRSSYHPIPNVMPFCSVNYSGTTIIIDTWILSDAYGTEQECAFNFRLLGAISYIISGRFNRLDVAYTVAKDKYSGTAFPGTMVLSNNAGRLRITLSGVSAGGNITGWIKEL